MLGRGFLKGAGLCRRGRGLLPIDLTPSCLELFNLRVGLLQEGVVGGPGGGEWLKGAWPDLCVDPPLQVLAQQRAEQQRRELAQATSSDAPMDPVTFIQTLPSELRLSVQIGRASCRERV